MITPDQDIVLHKDKGTTYIIADRSCPSDERYLIVSSEEYFEWLKLYPNNENPITLNVDKMEFEKLIPNE